MVWMEYGLRIILTRIISAVDKVYLNFIIGQNACQGTGKALAREKIGLLPVILREFLVPL